MKIKCVGGPVEATTDGPDHIGIPLNPDKIVERGDLHHWYKLGVHEGEAVYLFVGTGPVPPDCEAIVLATPPESKPARSTDRLLQFFDFAHLRDDLREASRPFGLLAGRMVATLPCNPERTIALRKLLEAKDAAVRCVLFKEPE